MKSKKQSLSFILAIIIVFSILPTHTYAAPSEDYTLTGRGIDDILAVAFAQEGKIGPDLGYTTNWCSFFVSWAWRHAKQQSLNHDFATPQHVAQWFVNNNGAHFYCFRDANYNSLVGAGVNSLSSITRTSRDKFTPQAGDIVCFLWEEDLGSYNWSHSAIVARDYDGKGILYTIEGNSYRDASPEAELETRAVRPRERPYDSTVIGVVRPVYTTAPYTVNHYLENYGGGYSLYESQTVSVARKTNVAGYVRSYDGFLSPTKSQAADAVGKGTQADFYYRRLYSLNIQTGDGIDSVSGGGSYPAGTTVTVTAKPNTDYDWKGWTAGDGSVSGSSALSYTFTMPACDVTLSTNTSPIPYIEPFRDARLDAWYAGAVIFVSDNQLMNGYGEGIFAPNNNLSRGMLAQILYNLEGCPEVSVSNQFADVSDEWFSNAVNWAASEGIVTGYDEGNFCPNNNITREQLAVMLWRYAGSPSASCELEFIDAGDIGNYALPAMQWAVENGIINGHGDGLLGPKGFATRAQVAQILKNYLASE